jgi:hypothetical protein
MVVVVEEEGVKWPGKKKEGEKGEKLPDSPAPRDGEGERERERGRATALVVT